jgi:hypothetical protein
VYNSPPLTPREARSITADGKTAPKVPDWAQSIGKFQQASETFSRLRHNTEDFAETKGYKLRHAGSGFGYNLDSYGGPVLRGRPMFVIVEYLGAQDIWKDV